MNLEDAQVNSYCVELMQVIDAELAKPQDDPTRDESVVRGSLERFADVLIYKDAHLIGKIPRESPCYSITKVIAQCRDADIVALGIVVVANYMEAWNGTIQAFVAQKILKWLRAKIEVVNDCAASDIMRIPSWIGRLDHMLIVRKFQVHLILKHVTRCRPTEKRRALALVQQICERCNADMFSQCIPVLIPFFEGNPPRKPFAIGAFLAIISNASSVPHVAFPAITRIVQVNADPKILLRVIQILRILRG
jgi:hypothetical protein